MCWKSTIAITLALISTGCERYHPATVSFSGTAVNGRVCDYLAADGKVVFAIVFNTQDGNLGINSSGRALRSGEGGEEVEDKFVTRDGHQFAVRYRHPGPVTIDGREYQLDAGRVFLIRLERGGNECEQLPLSLPPREDGHSDASYVGEELRKAATGNARLSAFLGIPQP